MGGPIRHPQPNPLASPLGPTCRKGGGHLAVFPVR